MRTLRSIISKYGENESKQERLDMGKLQIVQYTDEQLKTMYKYDLEYDDSLSAPMRARKEAYMDFFKDSKTGQPLACIQVLITGRHAISKVQRIIGDKDPKNA